MKKMLAILLALMMVLVSVAALADNEQNNNETVDPYNGLLDVQLQLPKSFTASHGTAPQQTFNFQFVGKSYTSPADLKAEKESTSTAAADIPTVSNVSVSFTKGDTETQKSVTVVLPMSSYKYGRYIYEVTEILPTPKKTAGITYAENKKMYMVVTVLSDLDNHPNEAAGTKHFVVVLHEDSITGEKVDRLFENTYDAGSLTVTKKLAGNMADLNDKFDFTIAFTAATGAEITAAQRAEITIAGTEGEWVEDSLTYKVTLGHNDSLTFSNIPAGTTYVVTETAKDGYEKSDDTSNADGTINGGDEDQLIVTNTRDVLIDTGVTLDSAVYMLIMALALAGIVVLKIRRREDY